MEDVHLRRNLRPGSLQHCEQSVGLEMRYGKMLRVALQTGLCEWWCVRVVTRPPHFCSKTALIQYDSTQTDKQARCHEQVVACVGLGHIELWGALAP